MSDPVNLLAIVFFILLLIIVGFGVSQPGRDLGVIFPKLRRIPIPQAEALFSITPSEHCLFRHFERNVISSQWNYCHVYITSSYVAIYPNPFWLSVITFNPNNIRWIGRVQETDVDIAEIFLDLDIDGTWHTIQLEMTETGLKQFADALEKILPDGLLTKRDRSRPNLRQHPVSARSATQVDDSNWSLGETVQLYLTPLYLVELVRGYVNRTFEIDAIANVLISPIAPAPNAKSAMLSFEHKAEVLTYNLENQDAYGSTSFAVTLSNICR